MNLSKQQFALLHYWLPLLFGLSAAALGALVSLTVGQIALVGVLATGWLSALTFLDVQREAAREEKGEYQLELFLTRAIASFLLPYVITAAWLAVAFLYGAKLNAMHVFIPFTIGAFLGRAAIEQFYVIRPEVTADDKQPSYRVFSLHTRRFRKQ